VVSPDYGPSGAEVSIHKWIGLPTSRCRSYEADVWAVSADLGFRVAAAQATCRRTSGAQKMGKLPSGYGISGSFGL